MSQLNLALLGCINEAGMVPHSAVMKIKDYREAVRMCWIYRRSQGMTQNTLAERVEGMYAQHLSDYLHASPVDKHGKRRRDLPASLIKGFQAATGNKFITQWQMYDEGLTVMESLLMERKAA